MKVIASVLIMVMMLSVVALLLGPKYIDKEMKREAKAMLLVSVIIFIILIALAAIF